MSSLREFPPESTFEEMSMSGRGFLPRKSLKVGIIRCIYFDRKSFSASKLELFP